MKLNSLLGRVLGVSAALCAAGIAAHAAERRVESPHLPPLIAPASAEGEEAIRRFVLPEGFQAELIAAEPMLANPVAFYIDNQGKVYVCETFRHSDGVIDIRGVMPWLDEELAAKSVEDRLLTIKRHRGSTLERLTRQTDQVRLIVDSNGDGRADRATVFATGFNSILSGIGAGVVARGDEVWYANIPDLWKLRDLNGDGQAGERRSLLHGFGVRAGFLGHDLHGLVFGPDGKLYFTVGDRGAAVPTDHGVVGDPETGSVFRCYPDGSGLEVFATGLRNPQELVFDQFGNLFTGDNNSDSGDRARWVYLVEGGDSGWRIGYQFMQRPYLRGPFNAERLWHPHFAGQAAYIVPPIANIGDGPSGVAYDPGTGMPEAYRNRFFLCDFHGGKGSGIHAFGLEPKGASFEVAHLERFVWEVLPTDVDFGVHGGIYYTDWVQGWNKTGKGRLYRIFEPESAGAPIVEETRKLLETGFGRRVSAELAGLLSHANMRVRQGAQFELAGRGFSSGEIFSAVAGSKAGASEHTGPVPKENSMPDLARLHAIWGLGQLLAMVDPRLLERGFPQGREWASVLISLLDDSEPELRAQAAKVLGDAKVQAAREALEVLVAGDSSARVRFFAAIALGKLRRPDAVGALVQMLRQNADADPYLRHAGVMGLAGAADVSGLVALADDPSRAVRIGVLLAMRRLGRSEVGLFLNDREPLVVAEAARAINDVPISGAMPELGAILSKPALSEPVVRRSIHANFQLGLRENAGRLAEFAARHDAEEAMRVESIQALAEWPSPSGRDRVTGLWRPTASVRRAEHAQEAFERVAGALLAGGTEAVQAAAAEAAGKLKIEGLGPRLFDLAISGTAGGMAKIAALRSLVELDPLRASEAVQLAVRDNNEQVRTQAVRLQARLSPDRVLGEVRRVLETGALREKQGAFEVLGGLEDAGADALLLEWVLKLADGTLPAELQLDVIEAAEKRKSAEISGMVQRFEARAPADELAPFGAVLHGGDPAAGQRVFFEKVEAQCVRCHKANGEGGDVGPDLKAVGARLARRDLLESIVLPNKQVTAGFETVLIRQKDGMILAGVVQSENDEAIVLNSPEDGIVTVKKTEIASRQRGLSSMPEGMGELLTRKELRDLIEFLSSLK